MSDSTAAASRRLALTVACPICQQGKGRDCIAIGRNAAPRTHLERPHPRRATAAAFAKIEAQS